MNILIIILLIIIIILFLLSYIHIQNKKNYNYNDNTLKIELPNYAFGNVLASYFYYVTKAYSENKNLYITNYNDNHKNFKELRKLLPEKIIIHNKYIYDSNSKELNKLKLIQPVSIWVNPVLLYNTIPILKDNTLITKNTKYNTDCIIHFRCSDIPFMKHFSYHLLKFKWYKWAINLCLKKTSINKIYILNCNKHNSSVKNKKKCVEWGNLLMNYIKNEFNIETVIMCNDIEKDILYMLNSKCLISSGSSLSFCLGMLTDNIFVFPSCVTNDKISECIDKPIRKKSICLKKDFIKHKDVNDYYTMNNSLFYS